MPRVARSLVLLIAAATVLGSSGFVLLAFTRRPAPVFENLEPYYIPVITAADSATVYRLAPASGAPAPRRVGTPGKGDRAWIRQMYEVLQTEGGAEAPPPIVPQWDVVALMQGEGQQACVYVSYRNRATGLGFGPVCPVETVSYSPRPIPSLRALFEEALRRTE